jgi:arsenite methyltransferase
MTDIRDEVRNRYAGAARTVADSGRPAEDTNECCGSSGSSCCGGQSSFGSELYGAIDRSSVPDTALLASLGCGNPTAVAELRHGEIVLDLGSGGGIDVLLSATRVGSAGKVYGLDMTEEMLALAMENKQKAEAENVEFLKGYIEAIPLPANTIDAVISNCVINLSADKAAVFAEMFRVLRPGGRIAITDVVAANELTPEERSERGTHVGCIAGALSFEEYESELTRAGFDTISVEATHDVADSMYSAIVKAHKPATGLLPVVAGFDREADCCR